MAIRFACPYCDKISSVPDTFAGKKGKCPNCQKVIEVPDPNQAEPEAEPPEIVGSRVGDDRSPPPNSSVAAVSDLKDPRIGFVTITIS